jgi:antitoxin (DNA-binding transcriptional repressor) of toxin-antitoxin stability system
MIEVMVQVHMTEAEISGNFAGALEKVRQGIEVVVEHDRKPVAVLTSAVPPRRTIAEILALMPNDSTATIDEDFGADVEAAIASHREPLDASQWD